MPNLNWSRLSPLQLGRYAEYYAKMEFTSYGFDVYSSEVDDHGVDFVAKNNGRFYEVQVKSARGTTYQYIRKDKIEIRDDFLICFLYFVDGELPRFFIFPSSVWKTPNAVFVDRNYDKPGQKSPPEYGISYSKKHANLLEPYRAEQFFMTIEKNSSEEQLLSL